MVKTGIQFSKRNLLITFHPVTLENKTSQKHFQALLDVLHDLEDVYLIFTMPNADLDGRIIKQMIDEFVSSLDQRSIAFNFYGAFELPIRPAIRGRCRWQLFQRTGGSPHHQDWYDQYWRQTKRPG